MVQYLAKRIGRSILTLFVIVGCRNTRAKCGTAAGSGIRPVKSSADRLQQGS